MNKVEVKVFNKGKQSLPLYSHDTDAGFDFMSDFSTKKSKYDFLGNGKYIFDDDKKELKLLSNGGRVLIPTGLHISLPNGYELQVRPRSGLALKHGISIVNSPGTIDQQYNGEIGIILINTDPDNDFIIKDGDRIAQGVLNEISQVKWNNVDSVEELGNTERGQGGFGSTGK